MKRMLGQFLDNSTINIVEAGPSDPWQIFDILSSQPKFLDPLVYCRLNDRIISVNMNESVMSLLCVATFQHQKSDDTTLLDPHQLSTFSISSVCIFSCDVRKE
jgi:hypothetical protein